ncbi:MAG: hypothetical protein IKH70_04395 [Stomatobaculum sp.]|nr:hypothetical protein [Stomatobaculum sp.]
MMQREESFPEYYAKQSPVPFYVLLSMFLISNMLLVVCFRQPLAGYVQPVRRMINAAVLTLSTMYTAFHLLLWKLKPATAAAGAGLIIAVGLGWNFIGRTGEFFCTAIAAFLAVLACRRDFRAILKIVLACHIVTMLIGAVGLAAGFTMLRYKVDAPGVGYSMGLIYPNHVGRMAFLAFMIIWYLWGQEKRFLTLAAGVLLSAVMWYKVECKTISFFLVGFPVCWYIVTFWTRLKKKGPAADAFGKIWRAAFIAMPFLCMGLTWFLGKKRAFFLEHWHYGQSAFALWMRFISAGILFKNYGFPLLGRDITKENAIFEINNGQVYEAAIVDNAYIYYLIAIGGIALILCMLWFSLGVYRAFRNQDYAFVLMSFFMCGYGLIEVVFFQFEHNFLIFYPLTATALAYKAAAGTEEAGTKAAGTEETAGETAEE